MPFVRNCIFDVRYNFTRRMLRSGHMHALFFNSANVNWKSNNRMPIRNVPVMYISHSFYKNIKIFKPVNRTIAKYQPRYTDFFSLMTLKKNPTLQKSILRNINMCNHECKQELLIFIAVILVEHVPMLHKILNPLRKRNWTKRLLYYCASRDTRRHTIVSA